MSDYIKAKVIRLPFPKSILEKFNTKNVSKDIFNEL